MHWTRDNLRWTKDEGGLSSPQELANRALESLQPSDASELDSNILSPRQWEVLLMLARGLTYKEISVEIRVNMTTVNTHIRRVYEKLGVRSRGEAVAVLLAIKVCQQPRPPFRANDA